MAEEDYPTLQSLEDWVKYWQPRLGLADWEIRVRFSRAKDMGSEDRLAEICACWEKKRAIASVVEERDYRPDFDGVSVWGPQDWEIVIVHELLHLCIQYNMLDIEEDKYNMPYEQGIDRLARTLVELRRASVTFKGVS
jgi:hypothetical protein